MINVVVRQQPKHKTRCFNKSLQSRTCAEIADYPGSAGARRAKKASLSVRLDFVLVLLFVSCSQAAGANVLGGLFSFDFHLYLLQIGTVRFGRPPVRVGNLVAGHLAFTAYSAYLGHIYTSVYELLVFKLTFTIISFLCSFGKHLTYFFCRLAYKTCHFAFCAPNCGKISRETLVK